MQENTAKEVIIKMDKKEHRERHKVLHKYLDELIADFIQETNKLPSETKLTELMSWSFAQTIKK